MALLAAEAVIVPLLIVSVASAPPLIPFLALPSALRDPSPKIVSDEVLLNLIAAPSKSEFAASVEASSLSVIVEAPSSLSRVALEPFITTGAVVEDESVRLSKIRVTSLSPFPTTMLPSEQLPVTR